MRILSIISSLAESGGVEMLVRNLSVAYAHAGNQCQIVYISDATSLGASADFEAAFKHQMDEAGVAYVMIGHDAKRNPLKGAWRLRRMVRDFRPDIIHTHLAYGLLFQVLGLIGAPTIYTHHNIVFKFPVRLFWFFNRVVDRYVAICGACETLLARHARQPITLIYNGVPTGFSLAGVRDVVSRDPTILSVGNLTTQKDYPTLIAAARRVVDYFAGEDRRVRFLIAGEGSERDRLRMLIAANGLAGHVELLGTRRDVPTLMAQADLMAMTSAYEGLPVSLIEAAMSALPVVATDVGGCSEVVVSGGTGELVPPGNADAIAAAIIALLLEPARYARYSAVARERSALFTLASCVNAHLTLYADVIAGRRRQVQKKRAL